MGEGVTTPARTGQEQELELAHQFSFARGGRGVPGWLGGCWLASNLLAEPPPSPQGVRDTIFLSKPLDATASVRTASRASLAAGSWAYGRSRPGHIQRQPWIIGLHQWIPKFFHHICGSVQQKCDFILRICSNEKEGCCPYTPPPPLI